jgi:HEAT repeat protein
MRRRDIIALTLIFVAIVLALVGVFALLNLVWLIVILVLVIVTIGTLIATSLSVYQQSYHTKLADKERSLEKSLGYKMNILETVLAAVQEREKREDASRRKRRSEENRIESLARTYLGNLLKAPEMSQVKILEMSVPIDLMSIYVRLRLHEETRPKSIHPALLIDEEASDPNSILRASLQEIGHNAGAAYDPDYAIDHFRRSVILGSPGAGKTTLLKYFALKCAKARLNQLPDTPIPVHIDLHRFANSDRTDLVHFAAAQWDDYGFPKTDALPYIVKNLQSGNALVLLDALDEALVGKDFGQAEESYTCITDAIRQLAEDYPLAFIVVTARTAGYQQRTPLMGFTELEILEFSSRDIEEFIVKWFNCYPVSFNKKPPDLIVELRKTSAIHTLASNPLLLVLIVLIYQRRGGNLPDQRAKLYKECVELLLERWEQDQKRQLFHEFKPEAKEYLLEDVAWYFHMQRRRYFPSDELLAVTAEFLPKISWGPEKNKVVIDEVSLDTGLLREWAKGWYAFLHLTLQEYFTALAADKKRDAGYKELLTHVEDPWWEEVILLYVSCAGDAGPFIEGLIDEKQYIDAATNPLFLPRLVLAGRCLAACSWLNKPALRDDITTRLLEELRHTPFSLVRQQLAESLAATDNDKLNGILIDMLTSDDDEPEVQVCVARALSMYANDAVVQELLPIVSNEQVGDEVRVSIVQALATSRRPTVASEFIKKLSVRWRMRDQVRSGIASALGPLIDSTSAAIEVVNLLREGHTPDIRCALVDALGASGVDPTVLVPALYSLYEDEKPGSPFYWHLAIALAVLGETAELSKLLSWLTKPSDNESGFDLYVSFKLDIIKALGTLRLTSLIPQFLLILPDERIHWEVRVGVASVLEAIGDRQIIPKLIRFVSQKEKIDSRVRAAIATIIGSLGDDTMVKPMLRLDIRPERDPRVYRSVVTAIGRLGEGAVVKDLFNWVVTDIDEVAWEADFTFNEDHRISVAERLNILDALQRLYMLSRLKEKDRVKLFEILLSLAKSGKEIDRTDSARREIQRQVIFMLPSTIREIAEKTRVETLLVQLLSDKEMLDDAHQALWMMRRRWPKDKDAVKTTIM